MREDFAANLVSGLLEARTGQQLTRDRHWRIETALAGLMREQGIENADQLARRLLSRGRKRWPRRWSRRYSTTKPTSSATARCSTS
ncbi:MAG: hypothetical protein R3E03_00865 [Novosphingobium sp.]